MVEIRTITRIDLIAVGLNNYWFTRNIVNHSNLDAKDIPEVAGIPARACTYKCMEVFE